MKIRFTLDTIAISILSLLIAFVGLVILFGTQAGIRISVDLPKGNLISPNQIIKLTFSQQVDFELVSSIISLEPTIDGFFEAVNPRTIQFVPMEPFNLNTIYTLSLQPSILNKAGYHLKNLYTWEFSVRTPLVVFLSPDATDSSIWSIDLVNAMPKRLTSENLSVFSFDVAPNGDFIVFTVINEQWGVDLWRVSRNGDDEEILLDCGAERCARVTIAPNGKLIAYSRESAGKSPDFPFGAPRIWVLDLENGSNIPIFEDPKIIGYDPSWSPDSKKLSFFNSSSDYITIIDFQNKQNYTVHSNTGGKIAWSPDSKKFLYTYYTQKEGEGRTQVQLIDISTNEITILIGQNDDHDYSYSSIVWSPFEDKAVLSLHERQNDPIQSLWFFNPNSPKNRIRVTNEPELTYSVPSWDPWGQKIIFQQSKLSGEYKTEIGFWQIGMDEPIVLAEGLLPQWLP